MWETLQSVKEIIATELNSVTDNPVIDEPFPLNEAVTLVNDIFGNKAYWPDAYNKFDPANNCDLTSL